MEWISFQLRYQVLDIDWQTTSMPLLPSSHRLCQTSNWRSYLGLEGLQNFLARFLKFGIQTSMFVGCSSITMVLSLERCTGICRGWNWTKTGCCCSASEGLPSGTVVCFSFLSSQGRPVRCRVCFSQWKGADAHWLDLLALWMSHYRNSIFQSSCNLHQLEST